MPCALTNLDMLTPAAGGYFRRGVSGGERKRVSVGHELLINPSMLLLDEPTRYTRAGCVTAEKRHDILHNAPPQQSVHTLLASSVGAAEVQLVERLAASIARCLVDADLLRDARSGLDSTTALQLVDSLHSLAAGGRAIITTIHQPSARLYGLLDKLLLLADGRPLYYGKVPWIRAACRLGIGECEHDSIAPVARVHRFPWVASVACQHPCRNMLAGGHGGGLVPPPGLHAAVRHQCSRLHPGPGLGHRILSKAVSPEQQTRPTLHIQQQCSFVVFTIGSPAYAHNCR